MITSCVVLFDMSFYLAEPDLWQEPGAEWSLTCNLAVHRRNFSCPIRARALAAWLRGKNPLQAEQGHDSAWVLSICFTDAAINDTDSSRRSFAEGRLVDRDKTVGARLRRVRESD